MGVVLGLVTDAAAEACGQALRMPWLEESTSPNDALPLVGSERRMPRYPTELVANYRSRLWQAWIAYEAGGSRLAIESQLAAAGFPGTVHTGALGWTWSEFWVHFAPGAHTVTSQGPLIDGSWTVGDGTILGPEGITQSETHSLRALVKKWKHSQWVCRRLVFQISGWTVGDGSDVGDPGLSVGGENAWIGVP